MNFCCWLTLVYCTCRHFLYHANKFSQNLRAYFMNYIPDTGHVCTCFNAFLIMFPNFVMKLQNFNIFVKLCTCRLHTPAISKVLRSFFLDFPHHHRLRFDTQLPCDRDRGNPQMMGFLATTVGYNL